MWRPSRSEVLGQSLGWFGNGSNWDGNDDLRNGVSYVFCSMLLTAGHVRLAKDGGMLYKPKDANRVDVAKPARQSQRPPLKARKL